MAARHTAPHVRDMVFAKAIIAMPGLHSLVRSDSEIRLVPSGPVNELRKADQ